MSKSESKQKQAIRGFYEMLTDVGHQTKAVIRTHKEEVVLDDILLTFSGDNGDMMGCHHLWTKMSPTKDGVKIQ